MSDDTQRRGRTTSTAAFLLVALLALPGIAPAQIPPCADGFLDVGEECDEGVATGTPESCCAIDCTFRPAMTPCRDTTGECDPADVCSGASGVCADVKRTDVCRPVAGVCDVEELCDGVTSDCPADAFASASVECRATAGVCDPAESCTGSSAACPADGKSTAPCRASAGICDLAESCDGVADECPADAKSTATCRPSAGVCDVAESCDGVADACPADDFEPASVECRAAASGCDVAESCTGSGAGCPSDALAPDETPCDDANMCSTADRCVGGICGGFLLNCGNGTVEGGCAEECDDGNFEVGDGCDPSCQFEPCRAEPVAGCRPTTVIGKAGVQIINRLNPDKKRLQWKYTPGDTTLKADFGNPLIDTSYQFCIWEKVGGDPRLTKGYAIPAGSTCGTQPCWKESSSGYKYTDKAHSSDGISGLILKQGLAPGKSKILLSGKGANLPIPVLPLVQGPNVVMQLRASTGTCWETRYDAPAFRNQPDQFRDK